MTLRFTIHCTKQWIFFYQYIMKSCTGAYETLRRNVRAWNDIYKRDDDLFHDATEGWQGLVALSPRREYLGHVYIRRGSRFVRNLHGPQNQLDSMEILGIRQSLHNIASCHGPDTPRWSLSKVPVAWCSGKYPYQSVIGRGCI